MCCNEVLNIIYKVFNMDLHTLKSVFSIFQPQNEEEYPRMCINMVGGVLINIENNTDNKITLYQDYMKLETPKTITFICLDDILKLSIYKQ